MNNLQRYWSSVFYSQNDIQWNLTYLNLKYPAVQIIQTAISVQYNYCALNMCTTYVYAVTSSRRKNVTLQYRAN